MESLVDLINQSQTDQKGEILEIVEEKFERRLAVETGKLEKKISETKAEIIKWMFIFWIGQIGVILGMLFAFFKR